MKGNKGRLRSSVVIAKLLASEGFNDYVQNCVETYWKHSSGLTERQRTKLENMKKEFGEFMKDCTEAEKLLVGRFIGLHKKMAFDTGLRIGLAAFANQMDKELPDETIFNTEHLPWE